MDSNSDGEDEQQQHHRKPNNKGSGGEGQGKPKRQMKTPFQLETLEKAYASEKYPTEATRVELSEKLGLTDRQLQMWFCHRRLKDRKEEKTEERKDVTPAKKPRKAPPPLPDSPVEELKRAVSDPGSDYGSGSGSGSSPYMDSRKMVVSDVPLRRGYFEPSPQSAMERRAIACVEAQLGEPLREDGPILGVEFDPLPPDAFGAPIAAVVEQQKRYPYDGKMLQKREGKSKKASSRPLHEYQFVQDQPSIRTDTYGQVAQHSYHDLPADTLRGRTSPFVRGDEHLPRVHGVQTPVSRVRLLSPQENKGHLPSTHWDDDYLLRSEPFPNHRIKAESTSHHMAAPESTHMFHDTDIFQSESDLCTEKKRKIKSEDARLSREAEVNEIRMRKELEKQEIMRRKNEEQTKKEKERQDRERKKEEERLMRERQREEEKSLREQKRELERREKMLQKENLRAEKQRQKEELRKEREEVRRKAAIEKATARRIAKESLDLIEDEQLELMELAAASKGLPSVVHLDYDTLQNLDAFRDSLCTFPSESIQLKKPFSFLPWVDSEDNVGNLLMVWRFCITFADVLGLWPFTLNEFIQAFHDHDSRLLGEIHVALMKLIIKDIEDVARTPTGLGTNQYSVANPEGGHPQIVEGAYMWGFDIRKWQQLLNPLSWPEIFRQLALSAGFGPQVKKTNAAWPHAKDEIKGCEETVSTLRNGLAAENAFALMREKGLLNPRKSRHRLTPGTVKFAAFHVLSLEGSEGLNVLELADKIQKSGLRDLSTSRTPEASISVALTRDQKLFERVAPSTYCVRSPYRKDPADGEEIIATARKKIQVFENGFLGREEDPDEVADEVDRDDDSEVEVDEDPEVDDLPITTLSPTRHVEQASGVVNTLLGSEIDDEQENALLEIGNDTYTRAGSPSLFLKTESENELSPFPLNNGSRDLSTAGTTMDQSLIREDVLVGSNTKEENPEIDESKSGESWVQGLTEGEYSHLSVEERLNALFVLVGIANEGNIIRAVLEDRLEAANALKKQMWAEAQLDKSRLREDVIWMLDLLSGKFEGQVSGCATDSIIQSPLHQADGFKEASQSMVEEQKSLLASENELNDNVHATDRNMAVQDPSNIDHIPTQQSGSSSKRFRSQLKAYTAHIAEETYIYRSLPLGQDRRRNRYWLFVASASRSDPCSGVIFVELLSGKWRVIDSEKEFDDILSSLDSRGIRESHLRIMMQKIEMSFKDTVRKSLSPDNVARPIMENEASERDSSPNGSLGIDSPSSLVCGSNSDTQDVFSSFRIELGRNERENKGALRRYEDLQIWTWKECLSSTVSCAMKHGKKRSRQLLDACDLCLDSYLFEDHHCLSCHQTFDSGNRMFSFEEHGTICNGRRKLDSKDTHASNSSLPLGIRLLRALLATVEASVPAEALEPFWTESCRKTWSKKLAKSSSIEGLLQMLTVFESAIKPDFLLPNYESTKELLGTPRAFYDKSDLSSVPVLPWIPKTMAAVALRLFELDASIVYVKQEKAVPSDYNNPANAVMKLHSGYSPLKNKAVELPERKEDYFNGEVAINPRSNKRNIAKPRRRNHDQGRRPKVQRKTPNQTAKRTSSKPVSNFNQGVGGSRQQHGREVNIQGTSRGPRTVRKRRVENVITGDQLLLGGVSGSRVPPPPKSGRYGGSYEIEDDRMEVDDASDDDSNNNNSDASSSEESDDDHPVEEYEHGGWTNRGFDDAGPSNGWKDDLMEDRSPNSDDEDPRPTMPGSDGTSDDEEDRDGDTYGDDEDPGRGNGNSFEYASGEENGNGIEDNDVPVYRDSGDVGMSDGSDEEQVDDDDKVVERNVVEEGGTSDSDSSDSEDYSSD
ncbi:unnamed protein product [Linum trigynum]|uniref:Homeobox-DDT domain protein RLT1 n=1 Tax=Linum trigynum TaxID=586398 RepID=A0AAV2FIF6_9ROSI